MLKVEKLLFVILLLAMLVRIPVFLLATRGFFIIGEGLVQMDMARNILGGNGFQLSPSMMHPDDRASSDFRDFQMSFYRRVDGFYGVLRPGRPTTYLVPGMAIFLAGIMLVFGQQNLMAILAVQLLLGVLTVFMGYRIAARFLKGRWLYAAGILMAASPYELYYQAIPATQALFSLLFIAGLLCSLRVLEKPAFARGAVAGVVWGAAFMVRPVSLSLTALLLVVILVAGRFSRKTLLSSAGLGLCFAAVLLPWGLRNRRVTGEFFVMPTQKGLIMWEFNGRIFSDHFRHEMPGAMLLYQPLREKWMGRLSSPELVEFPEFRDETEAHRDSVLFNRQVAFLTSNPQILPELVMLRFIDFFKPFPLNEFSIVHTTSGLLWFFWITVFMVAGGVLVLKSGGAAGVFMALGTGGYVLTHLLMAGGTPYRVAVDFPLLIMSLFALRYFLLRRHAGLPSRA